MKDGRSFGAPPKPYEPPAEPEGKGNTTDPDARRMKFGRNFIPAYNAQAVTTEDQIIPPPSPVALSTHKDSGWSSRSSPRSRRTGGLSASNEEAGQPQARSGAWLPPLTTS